MAPGLAVIVAFGWRPVDELGVWIFSGWGWCGCWELKVGEHGTISMTCHLDVSKTARIGLSFCTMEILFQLLRQLPCFALELWDLPRIYTGGYVFTMIQRTS